MAVTFDSCRSGFSRELWPFGPGEPKSSRLKPLLPGQSASGCLARHALVLRQVVVRRGAQLMRIEVVDHDGVECQRAQLLELPALVGGDPALAHALVELRGEVQRLDVAVLQRLEELALHGVGGTGLGPVAVDAAGRGVLARGGEQLRRASRRQRVWQTGEISVVAVASKKKRQNR